jgi:quercetin dioxygenase-like cupin family protein
MTNPETPPEIVTLAEVLNASSGPGPAWTKTSADLNVNLISFAAGQGVPAHVNAEVDVLLVAVRGEGLLEVDGVSRPFRAGDLCLVPKGATRAVRCEVGSLAYLTCHRRRGGLWPADPPALEG